MKLYKYIEGGTDDEEITYCVCLDQYKEIGYSTVSYALAAQDLKDRLYKKLREAEINFYEGNKLITAQYNIK